MATQNIDVRRLLATVDLCDLISHDLGQPVKSSGKYVFWRCPFHDEDTPSFAVTVDRYYCFGCRKSGDAITWLKEYRKLAFLDAIRLLGGPGAIGTLKTPQTAPGCAVGNDPTRKPLPDRLQGAWREVIATCEAALWSPAGAPALAYLNSRGLSAKTLKSPFARVGFSAGQKIADVWVDHGVVIPCFTVNPDLSIDYVNYIKLRRGQHWKYRPEDQSKYRKLPGYGADVSGLYGAERCKGADLVFVVEGELDALTLQQEAGDLVGVCSLGSASEQRLDWARWGRYLSAAVKIFVCLDADQAGQAAAEAWKGISGRVTLVQPPGGYKDVNEAHCHGVNLADWVMYVLNDNGAAATNVNMTSNDGQSGWKTTILV
jgi:DNA primase